MIQIPIERMHAPRRPTEYLWLMFVLGAIAAGLLVGAWT